MNLGMEIGVLDLSGSGNVGIFLNLEPRRKASENTIIGLRIAATINSLTYKNEDLSQFVIDEVSSNGVISIVPVIDYYWNDSELRPSLGIGIGSYLLVGFLDVFQPRASNPAERIVEVSVGHQLGLLLRGGFEWGKYRVGLEYNFTPIADVTLPNGQKAGTVDRRYLGFSLGFSLWGGRES